MGEWIVSFLEGNVYGYMLAAAEVLAAEFFTAFSFRRRRLFALRFVLFVLVFLPASALLGVFFETYFSPLRYLSACVLSFFFYPLCYKADRWDEIFCLAAAVASQNLAYSVSAVLVYFCGGDPHDVSFLYTALQVVSYVAVQAAGLYYIRRKMADLDGGFGAQRIPLIVVTVFLLIAAYALQDGRQEIDYPDFLAWAFVFICMDFAFLFLLFGIYSRHELNKQNEILDALRVSAEQQYEFEKSTIEMINIKSHDLKHQLAALRAAGGTDLEEQVREIEASTRFYDAFARTGSKPLDTVLSSKFIVCERDGIQYTYMTDGEKLAFMKPGDIYAFFGNAVDNAIAAQRSVADPDDRFLNLHVYAQEAILYIHIENSYDGRKLAMKDGLPLTTKESEKGLHGYGVLSMRRIAESYGGVLSVHCEKNLFCVDASIPLQTE